MRCVLRASAKRVWRACDVFAIGVMLILGVANAEGQTIVQLTGSPDTDDEPCFSPDGKWIVYQSRDSEGRPDLWVVPSEGGEPQQITRGAGYKCFPTWSPDGSRIVFASDPSRDWIPETEPVSMGAYDLHAIDYEDGQWSEPKALTNTPQVIEHLPSFSPDGTRIAYSSGLPTGFRLGDMAIMVMNADGTPVRMQQPGSGLEGAEQDAFRVVGRQVIAGALNAIEPSWSRDGKTLAFAYCYYYQNPYGIQYAIATVPADSAMIREIEATQFPQLEGYPAHAPAFSPKADLLAFNHSRGDAWDIWILPAPYDQSEPIRLTWHPAADVNPAWSPDGTRIAFASNTDGAYNIYIMDVPKAVLKQGGQE